METLRPKTSGTIDIAYLTPRFDDLSMQSATVIARWLEESNGLTRPRSIEQILEGFANNTSVVAWAKTDSEDADPEHILAGHVAITAVKEIDGVVVAEVGSLVVHPGLRNRNVAGKLVSEITVRVYELDRFPDIGESPILYAVTTSRNSMKAFMNNGYRAAEHIYGHTVENGKQLMVYSHLPFLRQM